MNAILPNALSCASGLGLGGSNLTLVGKSPVNTWVFRVDVPIVEELGQILQHLANNTNLRKMQ